MMTPSSTFRRWLVAGALLTGLVSVPAFAHDQWRDGRPSSHHDRWERDHHRRSYDHRRPIVVTPARYHHHRPAGWYDRHGHFHPSRGPHRGW